MRSWYAKRLPFLQYQVTCKYLQDGFEEDCGLTEPYCSREQLMDWLAQYMREGDRLVINDTQELLS